MPMKLRSGRSIAELIRKRPLPDPISRMTGLLFPNRAGKSRRTNPFSRGLISFFEIVVQPHVGVIPRRIDLAASDTVLDLAIGLVDVRAVIEPARLRGVGELGEKVAQ